MTNNWIPFASPVNGRYWNSDHQAPYGAVLLAWRQVSAATRNPGDHPEMDGIYYLGADTKQWHHSEIELTL